MNLTSMSWLLPPRDTVSDASDYCFREVLLQTPLSAVPRSIASDASVCRFRGVLPQTLPVLVRRLTIALAETSGKIEWITKAQLLADLALHGTRPWRVAGEGHAAVIIDGFREEQVKWDDDDFRFVQKDGKLYAYVMKASERKNTVITSLMEDEHVNAIRLLGHGPVGFHQHAGVLVVDMPEKLPTEYANVLEICF